VSLLLRFAGDKRAAALAGQTTDLEDSGGVSSGWVDVQGCYGVHGFASLCGGRVKRISTSGCVMSTAD